MAEDPVAGPVDSVPKGMQYFLKIVVFHVDLKYIQIAIPGTVWLSKERVSILD